MATVKPINRIAPLVNGEKEATNVQPTTPKIKWINDARLEELMAHEALKPTHRVVNLANDVNMKAMHWQTRYGHAGVIESHVQDIMGLLSRPDAVCLMPLLIEHGRGLQVVVGRHRLVSLERLKVETFTAYVLPENSVPSSVRRVSARSNFAQMGETVEDRLTGALYSLLGHPEYRSSDGVIPPKIRAEVADFWEVSEAILYARLQRNWIVEQANRFNLNAEELPRDVITKLWTIAHTRPVLFEESVKWAVNGTPDKHRFNAVIEEVRKMPEAEGLQRLKGIDHELNIGSRIAEEKKPQRVQQRRFLKFLARMADDLKWLTLCKTLEHVDATPEEVQQACDLCSDTIKQLLKIKKGKG